LIQRQKACKTRSKLKSNPHLVLFAPRAAVSAYPASKSISV